MLEIFWPSEIRRQITKYQAEGTLNLTALEFLNKLTRKLFILFIGIATVCAICKAYILAAIILCLLPLWMWIDIRYFYKNQMAPYAEGELGQLRVKEFICYPWGQRQKVICESLSFPVEEWIISLGNPPRLKKEDQFEPGKKISAYLGNSNHKRAMPDIDSLKTVYCLTITKI